jgi:pantothenate kinase
VQAIAMQKMGILPDYFILLNQTDEFSEQRIRQNNETIKKCNPNDRDAVERFAKNAIRESNIHMAGVKDVCRGLITELDGNKENNEHILEEIVRVLKLKRTKAPRRPQRVILMGPPGSGTEAQALKIAEKYKLVYVNVL